jgi:hypothetical protein
VAVLGLVSAQLAIAQNVAIKSAVTTSAVTTGPDTTSFGTYYRPYAADSLWNSRPVQPVLGTFMIPTNSYFPAIATGAYSTGVFLSAKGDKNAVPMTVYGMGTTATVTVLVADPDIGGSRIVTVPRWPTTVIPATGSDGHADIVDEDTGVIHSFWRLKRDATNTKWTAALYSWSSIKGSGWPDPAHFYQGARAVGIPASAGLMRKHEINDGKPTYTHALAMSLPANALANGKTAPTYIYPATSADNSAASNTGSIPEGALVMLPSTFDSSKIANADLRKIVETLKTYGAYVVDKNVGTPFVIYAENDSGFNLMPKGWDNNVAGQLDQIRAALRQVLSAKDWLDGNGKSIGAAVTAKKTLNILSMRGAWYKIAGTTAGDYDTAKQQLVFPASGATRIVQSNANMTGVTKVVWAIPPAGTTMKFGVTATNGALLRLQVKSGSTMAFDSKDLGHGQSARFTWPANATVVVIASSGVNVSSSTVQADLSVVP